jgi:hypothetical protein
VRIPRADTPGALSVSDGTETVGSIVTINGAYFAFDVEHVLVGTYASQREAMRAIPKLKKTAARRHRAQKKEKTNA